MKITRLTLLLRILMTMAIFCLTDCQKQVKSNWQQEDGYVPNETSAIKMAEIVWLNVYGPDINDEKPFHASLKDGKVWIVQGTLDKDKLGGVAYIEIQKSDGRILKVIHGK